MNRTLIILPFIATLCFAEPVDISRCPNPIKTGGTSVAVAMGDVVHIVLPNGATATFHFTSIGEKEATYRWQFRSSPDGEITTGTGRVFEDYERVKQPDGRIRLTRRNKAEDLMIQAGEIWVLWSHKNRKSSWISYCPELATLTLVQGPADESQINPIASEAPDLQLSIPVSQLEALKRAKEFCERGNYEEAGRIYDEVLLVAPDNLYVLSNLGVVRLRAGKLPLAADALRRAITVEPKDDFSYLALGLVHYVQGSYDEAVGRITKALSINPRNAFAHQYLSILAAKKGWREAATKELETAIRLDPSLKGEPAFGNALMPWEKSRLQIPSVTKP